MTVRARATIARAATRARLTAIGCGTATVLACVTVSACTTSSKPPSEPTGAVTSTILANGSPSPTTFYSGTAVVSPTTESPTTHPTTESPTTHPTTQSPSPSPTPVTSSPAAAPPVTQSPTPTQFPTEAPPTGGGGTAGLQYGLLFGLGASAIIGGGWSIAYRRKLLKGQGRR
jgi:hypothetical protein